MHGRLKVRTTEEERERKRKEQDLKVRAYRAAMSRIQRKRAEGELDDELLVLTVQVLQRNPDVNTLWNIRRECVLLKLAKLEEEEQQEKEGQQEEGQQEKEEQEKQEKEEQEKEKPKKNPEAGQAEDKSTKGKKQAVFNCELNLTEQCLMVNPKSYNAWHHRCWTLEQNPRADWQRELLLCNKYLKYDERNFHTWDYRRFVTAKAAVPAAEELDFCTEKIKVNFSNYSSWHHRSLLLPQLYPNARRDRPMSESKLQQELEMVLTAAFTDPNDSSAWFYQRWLLGSGAQLDRPPRVVAFRVGAAGAVLALDKPVRDLNVLPIDLGDGEQRWPLQGWQSVDGGTAWKCQQSFAYGSCRAYSLKLLDQEVDLLPVAGSEEGLFFFEPPHVAGSCSNELLTELQAQLKSCLDLLEFEPDSKWTLLTSALLMRAIDVSSNHEQSLKHLVKLEKVDALRQGYYRDLAARWVLEFELARWPKAADFPRKFELAEKTAIASLPYGQYLVIADELKLSRKLGDELEARLPKGFGVLQI
ncbi:hypothetical protein KR018_009089 [Drosophila ironensis]|nr:hypothetical protein KR018_009089 [Drosophila ironensis]